MIEEFHTRWLTPAGLELVKKYPLIFFEKDDWAVSYLGEEEYEKRAKEGTYVALRYGFEFGAGWLGIVEEWAKKVTDLIIKDRLINPDSYVHTGIFKEKFSSLRNQGSHKLTPEATKEFNKLDQELEEKSLATCEICGSNGKTNSGPWYKVRCENCK